MPKHSSRRRAAISRTIGASFTGLLLMVASMASGCASGHSTTATALAGSRSSSPVIAAEVAAASLEHQFALQAEGRSADLVTFDVRPRDRFLREHVRHAVHEPLEAWSARATRNPSNDRFLDEWFADFEHLNIDPFSRVLIYGDSDDLATAALAWFALQSAGFTAASVVDGGFDSLKPLLPASMLARRSDDGSFRDDRPLCQDPFVPRHDSVRVGRVDADAVRNAIDGTSTNVVMLARSVRSIDGQIDSDVQNSIDGHAATIRASDLLEDGRLRTPASIRDRLGSRGIRPNRPTIVVAGSPSDAALVALALVHSGFGDVAIAVADDLVYSPSRFISATNSSGGRSDNVLLRNS